MGNTIQPAVKNQYFTYFQVQGDSQAKVHREAEQIWRINNTNMQIQGTMPTSQHWGDGTYNCFAKKHLVSVQGSPVGTTQDSKARSILAKRNLTNAAQTHGKRGTERTRLFREALAQIPPQQRKQQQRTIQGAIGAKYEQFAYGATRTDVCTFVLLDKMSAAVVKTSFADAIAAHDWQEDQRQDVLVEFPENCVVTHANNGTKEWSGSINVGVVYKTVQDVPMYYIFHCNGAGEPSLAMQIYNYISSLF